MVVLHQNVVHAPYIQKHPDSGFCQLRIRSSHCGLYKSENPDMPQNITEKKNTKPLEKKLLLADVGETSRRKSIEN